MADTGTPPAIPANLQQYDSYLIDPKWQVKFTIIWTSVLGAFALFALPAVIRGFRKSSKEAFGVTENWRDRYTPLADENTRQCCGGIPAMQPRRKSQVVLSRILSTLGSFVYWTPPGIGLNAGQSYAAAVLACVCTSAELVTNPNRAGFLALAQLTPVFLLASKNTAFSLILPPFFAYSRLNFLHRWTSRTLFLSAAIHGTLWINNHLVWNIPILGQQKETSGVAAFGVLCAIVLSSLRPVRIWAWDVFYWVHFMAVPAFFITVCYHTMYAAPWIFPPIALYAFDILMRAGRFRLKDARLIPVDDQMTIIHIPDCDDGFQAGQHIRLRIFFEGRLFEAHPLSIMCGPSSTSHLTTCLSCEDIGPYYDRDAELSNDSNVQEPRVYGGTGILLGARAAGNWTKALNKYARTELRDLVAAVRDEEKAAGITPVSSKRVEPTSVPVQVIFDGPYGGCSIDLGAYERVLLVAGGSGATFAIGCMDALVALCARPPSGAKAPRTKNIHFVWCIRSFGSITWFAPLLSAIARTAQSSSVRLAMTIYVTCMCSPEEVNIPGLQVRVGGRPDLSRLVQGVPVGHIGATLTGTEEDLCTCGCVDEALSAQAEEEDDRSIDGIDGDEEKGKGAKADASVAVCASGPESLTTEAANAVAKYAAGGREVGFHSELFAI
ncbi:hypothetical protein H0H92_015186 [Tricholoma furcatifolium]|nr:hypothetical protein H0H92_015186 [Tricholoma furcatifolium]